MIGLSGVVIVSAGLALSQVRWSTVKEYLEPDSKSFLSVLSSQSSVSPGTISLEAPTHSDTDSQDVILEPQDNQTPLASKMPEITPETSRVIQSTALLGAASSIPFGPTFLLPASLFATGFLAAPIFKESFDALVKERTIKVDILDATVISSCLVFSQIGVAAFMVWVLDVADLLLERTRRTSKAYIAEAFGKQASYAWLLVDGEEVQVQVQDLKKGDLILVGTGEQIPVDGLVLQGDAMVDQQSLTGEAAPVEKREGDLVYAMTTLVAGQIRVEVTETGQNTLASRIIQIVNDAAEYKVDVQSSGEKMADKMVLPTLGLGAMSYILRGPSAWLATINADFGTGIRVAAPISLLASLGNAARNDILIKDGKVLEILPMVDVVLFDKTGTLTYDVPVVSQIIATSDTIKPEDILFYTATAEQKFTHPIASAVLQKAEELALTLPKLEESHYHVGLGIDVTLDGAVIKVGSSRYMEREGIAIPQIIQDALQQSRAMGNSAILTALDNELVGMIEMQSTPRDEAKYLIEFLKTKGVSEIVLISGDHEAPTKDLAGKLGIENFVAGVLPHEKAAEVKKFQEAGKKVMMVGDGINDSGALSLADVSVSLSGASTIATDVADVIFMSGDLKQLDYLYQVSETFNQNVNRSFQLILLPNALCIAGAMVGVVGLPASLILNNGFNVLASLNGVLPLMGQKDDTLPYAQ